MSKTAAPAKTTTFTMATPAMDLLAKSLMRVSAFLAKWTAKVDAAKAEIKAAIPEGCDGIQGATWKATYKQDKDSLKVDWEKVALELAAKFGDAGLEHLTTIQAANTSTKAGAWKFLFTPTGASASAVHSGK